MASDLLCSEHMARVQGGKELFGKCQVGTYFICDVEIKRKTGNNIIKDMLELLSVNVHNMSVNMHVIFSLL